MENSFEIGEIVLGKVKGYPYWPGIITRKKGKSPWSMSWPFRWWAL